MRVVWNGVDPEFTPSADEAARERARARFAGGRPFLLYLGTLEPRKNVVDARRRLRAALVAGPGPARSRARRRRGLEGRAARAADRDVPFPGPDPPRRVRPPRRRPSTLYRSAEVFVYPSLAEGFGLPVVEAMACALPVVCSDTAALTEVGGDAALYAPAADVGALALAIERALEDPAERRRLREAGPRRAALFSWKTTVEQTAEVLAEAAAA